MKMIITSNTECNVFLNDFTRIKLRVTDFQYSIDSGETWVQNPQSIDTSRSLMVTSATSEKQEQGITLMYAQCVGFCDVDCVITLDEANINTTILIIEGNNRILYEVVII
jgi:hypothetical protein